MNHHHRHCGLNRWSRRLTGSIGFEVEPVNYALMAISSSSSSSSSDNEVQKCSKQCLESFKTLQKNYDSEREKYSLSMTRIQGYELALESLESRILVHEKNKLAWVNMSARDNTGLGYGTQLNEMSNNSKTDSEISLSVYDVRSSDEENTPTNDRFSKADGFHAIPHLYNRETFLPQELTIFIAGLITPVKQNEKRAVHTVSTARPVSTVAVVDSGCSSHMTGNKAYLSDYEDYNEGFVAFGSDPKGGLTFSLSHKCVTRKIVSFLLSLNALSWSPSFKLLDESQVVLRAPRKDVEIRSCEFQDLNKLGSRSLVRGLPLNVFVNDPLVLHVVQGTQDSYVTVEDVASAAHEKPSESSPKDNDVQDSKDVADKEGQHQMTEDEQVLHDKLEKMIAQEVLRLPVLINLVLVCHLLDRSNTPYVSAASTSTGANAGESSFVYLGGKIPIDASTLPNADLPIDPNMPDLEDASDTLP
ncbi:hypothetical protein Tco_1375408 [Tanacetum coccineum]